MHPTRRKLVNMVLTGGEYEKNTQISFANADKSAEGNRKREVGEIWTDSEGKTWEQKEYGKVRINELSETMSDVRAYLQQLNSCKAEDCKTIKLGRVDKKLISKTGYCLHCLTKKEAQIKYDGDPTGIANFTESNDGYTIFPNPTKNSIIISQTSKKFTTCEIYNLNGQLLNTQKIDANYQNIDLSGYSEGVYILKLDGKEASSFKKVVLVK